ncbi:MAG: hypothetical protein EBZ36_03935, partial [Acidobacteria bacterium]|nr:hypothetical protein [Acidobacteriota bacterium]
MSVNISKQVNRKKVSILGSTGSIGCNTLRVIEAFSS